MADDRSVRGRQDRQRSNLSEDYEVTYWSKKWDVSREQLAEAVRNRADVGGRRQAAGEGTVAKR
jgi:hypothetical protein